MSMRIATNVQSLAAQRFLTNNTNTLNKSLERLSSGSRINRAGDDAAGLAISEKLRSNIRSMKQAARNANDGISLVQVAEGAMNEIDNILIRMRELSTVNFVGLHSLPDSCLRSAISSSERLTPAGMCARRLDWTRPSASST